MEAPSTILKMGTQGRLLHSTHSTTTIDPSGRNHSIVDFVPGKRIPNLPCNVMSYYANTFKYNARHKERRHFMFYRIFFNYIKAHWILLETKS